MGKSCKRGSTAWAEPWMRDDEMSPSPGACPEIGQAPEGLPDLGFGKEMTLVAGAQELTV